MTPTATANHPDAATLAAYLDRRLPEAERLQVVEHLAACPDCWERTSDAADVLEDLESTEEGTAHPATSLDTPEEGGSARVSPSRGSRPASRTRPATWAPPKRWVPVAVAAILLVAAVGLALWFSPLSRQPGGGPSLEVEQLAATLPEEADVWRGHLGDHPWGVTRDVTGPPDGLPSPTAQEQRALRLGARAVRLQAALAAGDGEAARGQLESMARHAEQLTGILALAGAYRDLADRLAAGAAPRSLTGEAARLDELATGNLENTPYALGKWAEAGRLAALSGDPNALGHGAFRGIPATLQRDDWPPRLAAPLAALEALLTRDDADPGAVADAFAAVLAAG